MFTVYLHPSGRGLRQSGETKAESTSWYAALSSYRFILIGAISLGLAIQEIDKVTKKK